jgi:hypothetical protein
VFRPRYEPCFSQILVYNDTAALACTEDREFESPLLHSCFLVSWDSTTISRASDPPYKAAYRLSGCLKDLGCL